MYIAIGALGNTYMRQEQDLMNNYFFLAANQNNLVLQDLMNYRENIFLYIIKIAIPLLLSRILCDSLNAYYAHVFKKSLSIKFLEKILDKQRFLSFSNEAEYFSTEYIEDINILVDRIWIESSNHHDYGIVNDIAYIIPKLYLISYFRKEILIIFPLTIAMDVCYNSFYQGLIEAKQKCIDKNQEIKSQFNQKEHHDREHSSQVLQKGGLVTTAESWLVSQDDFEYNNLKILIYRKILSNLDWIYNFEVLYNILRYGVASLIYYKTIGAKDLFLFTVVLKSVSDVICFGTKHKSDTVAIDSSIQRLSKLYSAMDDNIETSWNVVHDINHHSKELIIHNLSFVRGDARKNITLNLKDLSLEKGAIYSLTGDNAKGKSSLISLLYYVLNGVVDNSYSQVSGYISYPGKDFGIIPQNDYCPLNISLFELVLYPKKCSSISECDNYINKVVNLMREFKVDYGAEQDLLENMNDRKNNWCNELSGGQLKKIFLINQFLHCPTMLFLDETLTPLDHESRLLVSRKIKTDHCLKNSIVLLVHHDHDLIKNEEDCKKSDFFDYILNLNNNTVELEGLCIAN